MAVLHGGTGDQHQQHRSQPPALVAVGDRDRRLGHRGLVRQAHVARHAHARLVGLGGVQRHPGDVIMPVDLGEVPQLPLGQLVDSRVEAQVARTRGQQAQAFPQALFVAGLDRTQECRGAVP